MITFTVPEAAKTARVNERTLRRAIVAGEVPSWRPSPRRTLVWWDDVAEWAQNRAAARAKRSRVR